MVYIKYVNKYCENIQPIILAVARFHKHHLILDEDEQNKIQELITLLEPFKHVVEQFGRDQDVTLTSIVPMFHYLKTNVLIQKPTDSQMIKDMKKHMLTKLENRYNQQQMNFLKTVTVLDPRVKSRVITEQQVLLDLKSKVKAIVQATVPDQIPPTQNQEYHNLQSTSFTTPPASSSPPDGPSHSHMSAKDILYKTVYDDDSDDDVPANISQLDEKIDVEVNLYKSIKLTSDQKRSTHLLTWWKEHKGQFPCLFQAVKALLGCYIFACSLFLI